MKKYLIIFALLCMAAAAAATMWGIRRNAEVQRLRQNQYVLCDTIRHYRTRLGEEAASVAALRLRCDELKRLRGDDAARLKEMGIRLRRVESIATSTSRTQVDAAAPLRDTVIVRDTLFLYDTVRPLADSCRIFNWSDGWVSVEGIISRDSAECRVESIDTLRQYVHRVPHRFLFLRWGTKRIRQEIVCSNPHTHIVWAEYIEIEKRRKRR